MLCTSTGADPIPGEEAETQNKKAAPITVAAFLYLRVLLPQRLYPLTIINGLGGAICSDLMSLKPTARRMSSISVVE